MKYGVTITSGASPWQIFQQGADGTAEICVKGEYHLVRLSQEIPLQFNPVPYKKTTIKASVLHPESPPWSRESHFRR